MMRGTRVSESESPKRAKINIVAAATGLGGTDGSVSVSFVLLHW